MRTTLNIDDDVLRAAKELAEQHKTTTGRVISDLVRQALTKPADRATVLRNGFRVLAGRGGLVTSELVARLADDEA